LRISALKEAYILVSVIKYIGETFKDLMACYAGWMNREKVGTDVQTFDARTVNQKVDVNQDSNSWIPFILDVAAQEIIYVDLYSSGWRMIEANKHFPSLASSLASYSDSRPTFGALAHWYIRANHATLVEYKDANITIGIKNDCSINVLELVGQGVTSF